MDKLTVWGGVLTASVNMTEVLTNEGRHQLAVSSVCDIRQPDDISVVDKGRRCGSITYMGAGRTVRAGPSGRNKSPVTEGTKTGEQLQLHSIGPVRTVSGSDVYRVQWHTQTELSATHNDLRFCGISRAVTTGGGMRPSAKGWCSHEREHKFSAEAERTANGQFHTDRIGRQNLSFTASYIDKHPVSEHTINPMGVWGCIIHCRGWNTVRYSAHLSSRNAQRDANRSVRNEPIGSTVGILNKSQSMMREVVA